MRPSGRPGNTTTLTTKVHCGKGLEEMVTRQSVIRREVDIPDSCCSTSRTILLMLCPNRRRLFPADLKEEEEGEEEEVSGHAIEYEKQQLPGEPGGL
jgi:hypothetical protein